MSATSELFIAATSGKDGSTESSTVEGVVATTTTFDDEYETRRITIRQDPLSITLDGPSIWAVACAIIIGISVLRPGVAAALVALAPTIMYIYHDYQNYLRLGPGGTPSTFVGYLRIAWYKLWALRDPFAPLTADTATEPPHGALIAKALPYRCGPRPRVAGIAPQRQIDQFGSRQCYLALKRILVHHSQQNVDDMDIGTSCFERHGMGLFARFPVNNTCQGEICHVHDSDYSMHLNLHPDDAREVLKKGWGQRHPLSVQGGWLQMPVPKQFIMIYAPRSAHELRVVCQIIEAAGWWVMAKKMEMEFLSVSIKE